MFVCVCVCVCAHAHTRVFEFLGKLGQRSLLCAVRGSADGPALGGDSHFRACASSPRPPALGGDWADDHGHRRSR